MLKKIAIIFATIVATAYLIFALFFVDRLPSETKCRGVQIVISDNDLQVLSIENIEKQLKLRGLDPKGKEMDKIATEKIEKMLLEYSIIKECQCYKTHKNLIGIHISCKRPIIHVFDQTGSEYYLDSDGAVIRSVQNAIYLPVASGDIKGEETQKNLVKVALFLQEERFWREQVEQIYVTPKQEMILVPRIGNHLVELGKADNLETKLAKLKEFYVEGLNKVGWNKYKRINIEFDKQVICTKKD
ncbi:MAG: cell division protein FtsQ [Bacteroidaceae bacterium]|jgi:cell division protein FtsQ|nr:cell division protein FtsQ [Bacteroidaceae bacterium]